MYQDSSTIDPKVWLENQCLIKDDTCKILNELFKNCQKRVLERGKLTAENCSQELIDYTICIDKCVWL